MFVKLIVCVTLISRFQKNREIISVYVINEVLYTYQNFPDVFQIHLFRCHLMLHSQSPRPCLPRVFPCRQNLDKKRDKSFKIINKIEYLLSTPIHCHTHTTKNGWKVLKLWKCSWLKKGSNKMFKEKILIGIIVLIPVVISSSYCLISKLLAGWKKINK